MVRLRLLMVTLPSSEQQRPPMFVSRLCLGRTLSTVRLTATLGRVKPNGKMKCMSLRLKTLRPLIAPWTLMWLSFSQIAMLC